MRWLLVIGAISSCNGDKPCGAALDAGTSGATVTVGTPFVFGDYTASQNNDCTPLGGAVSVTVQGTQVTPAPGGPTGMVLCLPRPDDIDGDPIPLSDTMQVQVSIDIFATDGPCQLRLDHSAVPTGTITFKGFCTKAGAVYGMTLAGAVGGFRSCPVNAGPPVETPVTLELGGGVAVGAL